MGKFISFGKYNKLYKYILISFILRIIIDYIYSDLFPSQIRPEFFYIENYPPSLLVDRFFYYLGTFILSFFLKHYEKSQKKIKKSEEDASNKNLPNIELIYYDIQIENFKPKELIITSLISIISLGIIMNLVSMTFNGLIYWVFDLFFVSYINYLMFNIPIYSHKKLAIAFRSIVPTFFQVLQTFTVLFKDYNVFYKNHIIFIPIVIILYLCVSLARFYSLCKIKYFFDYKYINVSSFLTFYSLIGMLVMFSSSIIATFLQCPDENKIEDISSICLVRPKKDGDDFREFYYDHIGYFFIQLWRVNRSTGINIIYLLLYIFKLFLNAVTFLYSILIVKYLSPEYYLISYDIYCFFQQLFSLITSIIAHDDITLQLYQFISETGALIGMMVYLELIELKFFNLNRNLRKNIQKRSFIEYNINNILEDDESIE